jgi:ABC-type transporter Mla subunit MlaD
MASPSDHRRTEDQAVEIALALFLGVLACVVVVLVSWLLRLAVGAGGTPVWSVVTAVAAPAGGLMVVVRQLLRAGL